MNSLASRNWPVVLHALRLLEKGASQVLDVGGNIGNSYYAYERYLSYPKNLQWTVHDLPAVHLVGRAQAAEHDHRRQLMFVDDLRQVSSQDILLANGALQFLPVSLRQLLSGLSELPPHLIVDRIPIHPSKSFFTLRSIGTAYCPYRVLSEQDFLGEVTALGYELVDRWPVPDLACVIPFEPAFSFSGYQGFYFKRQLSFEPRIAFHVSRPQ